MDARKPAPVKLLRLAHYIQAHRLAPGRQKLPHHRPRRVLPCWRLLGRNCGRNGTGPFQLLLVPGDQGKSRALSQGYVK